MDVYFVNVLLASALAYGIGFWRGKNAGERRIGEVVRRLLASGQMGIIAVPPPEEANVTDNVTKH